MANPLYRKNAQINLLKVSPRCGFTLVEVLIALALLLMVVQVGFGLFFGSFTSYLKISSDNDVRNQLRLGMNRMERELREARWLTTSTNSDNLQFRMPKYMTEKNPQLPITYATDKIITYYVKDGELLRKIHDISANFDGQTPNRGDPLDHVNEGVNSLARNIESLHLEYLPEGAADNSYKNTVIVTLQGKSSSGRPISLTSTVHLRAQKGW